MKTTLGILNLSLFLSCVLTGINAAGNSKDFDEKELKTYLQPDDIGRDRKYDDLNHNNPYLCTRSCKKYPKPRLCYYVFNVEHYSAMGPACRDCSTGNETGCRRRQCILADGIERSVISINRMIPGPTINVCAGDKIVVDVVNKLATSALTIHWHGVLQRSTPWMDGVPYVTQCPIQPNSMFRYSFPADTNGTFLYHAHLAHLHANGVYGALIVRPENILYDDNLKYHDFDLPSHTIQVSDWNHLPAEALFPGFYKNKSHIPEKHDLHLINGYGSYIDEIVTKHVSTAKFHVQCGKKYRFRIIASTTSTCSFKFAVQNHSMSVVALDGYPCKPTDVNTIVMSSGQRTDVVVNLNKGKNCEQRAYLIVVKGMDACKETFPQTAHLIYDNSSNPPTRPSNWTAIHDNPPYLNNHKLSCTHHDNVCSDTLPPAGSLSIGSIFDGTEKNYSFTIRPGFYKYPLDELFETNTYNPFYVPFGPNGTFTATLNNVSGIVPPVSLLTQENEIPKDMRICHGSCEKNESFCRCINILEVGLNSRVEVQFEERVNDVRDLIIHPIHLHGHHFRVITPAPIGPHSFVRRIERDTAHIPLDGSARIQFKADNPGYWIMHCHFSPHLDGGMFLIFKVGNSSDFKRPPDNFPKCGNFKSPVTKF